MKSFALTVFSTYLSFIMSTGAKANNCCVSDTPLLDLAAVRELDTLERIPCSITREEFEARYEFPRRPVILVGCDENWPARNNWSFEVLAERFDGGSRWEATFDRRPAEGHVVAPWRDIRNAILKDHFFYIFDQLLDPEAKGLENDYVAPKPFKNVDLYRTLIDFPEGYGPRRWFVMGSKNSCTDPHLDPSGTDAWNTVLRGYKWWIIYPPAVEVEDVMCDPSCSAANRTTRHWYASVGVNTDEDNYGGRQRAIHVLQKPHETIYVPYGRVHSVYNLEDCIGITENYGSPAAVVALWQSLVTEGTLAHRRQFYFQVLDDGQRHEVHASPFFRPSQVGLHPAVLFLLERFGMAFLAVPLGILAFMFTLIFKSDVKSSRHSTISKKTVVVRKVTKQQKDD